LLLTVSRKCTNSAVVLTFVNASLNVNTGYWPLPSNVDGYRVADPGAGTSDDTNFVDVFQLKNVKSLYLSSPPPSINRWLGYCM